MQLRLSRLAFISLVLITLTGSIGYSESAPSAEPLKILFIGNSLTLVNDLPKMLTQLAKAGGEREVLAERETPGGCTLEKHWKDKKALAKIQSRKWDIVVLQDYSSAPILKRESMFEYGKMFDAEIKKQGAKTLLYLTWAYKDKPQDQTTITKSYLDLAKEIGAQVAPAGVAWQKELDSNPELALHQKDKKHPTPAGTYLAACVFYATIFDKSPVGLPGEAGHMSDAEARPLQSIAWDVVHKTGK